MRMVVAIACGIVGFRSHNEAYGIIAEIMKNAPCSSRNNYTFTVTSYDEGLYAVAIIDVNGKSSGNCKQRFMAMPVGMTTASLTGGDGSYPKNTCNGERYMRFALSNSENPSTVNILR